MDAELNNNEQKNALTMAHDALEKFTDEKLHIKVIELTFRGGAGRRASLRMFRNNTKLFGTLSGFLENGFETEALHKNLSEADINRFKELLNDVSEKYYHLLDTNQQLGKTKKVDPHIVIEKKNLLMDKLSNFRALVEGELKTTEKEIYTLGRYEEPAMQISRASNLRSIINTKSDFNDRVEKLNTGFDKLNKTVDYSAEETEKFKTALKEIKELHAAYREALKGKKGREL